MVGAAGLGLATSMSLISFWKINHNQNLLGYSFHLNRLSSMKFHSEW